MPPFGPLPELTPRYRVCKLCKDRILESEYVSHRKQCVIGLDIPRDAWTLGFYRDCEITIKIVLSGLQDAVKMAMQNAFVAGQAIWLQQGLRPLHRGESSHMDGTTRRMCRAIGGPC